MKQVLTMIMLLMITATMNAQQDTTKSKDSRCCILENKHPIVPQQGSTEPDNVFNVQLLALTTAPTMAPVGSMVEYNRCSDIWIVRSQIFHGSLHDALAEMEQWISDGYYPFVKTLTVYKHVAPEKSTACKCNH